MGEEVENLVADLELPRPAVCFADHSYPAYSAKQMREFAAAALQRLQGENEEVHRLLDSYGQARTEGEGAGEEVLTLSGRILNLEADRRAAEAEAQRLQGERDEAVADAEKSASNWRVEHDLHWQWKDRAQAAEAQVEAMRKALEPFVKAADKLEKTTSRSHDGGKTWPPLPDSEWVPEVLLGWCRTARAALAGTTAKAEESSGQASETRLTNRLRTCSGMIKMCEPIPFGSDAMLMDEAAARIEALEASERTIRIHPPEAKPSVYAEAGPSFHWREGWNFTARDDIGGVLIENTYWPEFWLLVPRREWKSIIKAVAETNPLRGDEDPEAFDAAVDRWRQIHDLQCALEASESENGRLRAELTKAAPAEARSVEAPATVSVQVGQDVVVLSPPDYDEAIVLVGRSLSDLQRPRGES